MTSIVALTLLVPFEFFALVFLVDFLAAKGDGVGTVRIYFVVTTTGQ